MDNFVAYIYSGLYIRNIKIGSICIDLLTYNLQSNGYNFRNTAIGTVVQLDIIPLN